jgi:hypothetical protein
MVMTTLFLMLKYFLFNPQQSVNICHYTGFVNTFLDIKNYKL